MVKFNVLDLNLCFGENKVIDSCLQDVMMKIEKVKKLEKKVSDGHGHGGPSKSCFKIKENVQDEDIEKYL